MDVSTPRSIPGSEEEARAQAAAWLELAGRWRSDLATTEEIGAILRSRSQGRDFELGGSSTRRG